MDKNDCAARFKEAINACPSVKELLTDGVYLSGGFIRDCVLEKPFKDIDLFFRDEKSFKLLCEKINHIPICAYVENVIIDGCDVQLIHKKFFDTPEMLIDSFDYTAVMFCYHDGDMTIGSKTLDDLKRKILRVNVITKPLSSMNRMVRYQKMKFNTDDAYNYVASLFVSKHKNIILGAEYYDG